jgi:hypothetical protein
MELSSILRLLVATVAALTAMLIGTCDSTKLCFGSAST